MGSFLLLGICFWIVLFLGIAVIVAPFLSGRLGVCPPVTIAAGLAKTRQK
ncbi:hypothetical protein [Turicibacter sp. GALT-G1]|nr:hypothetical protein [Turicibacter sp. GALT-G1]MCU7207038.1 hypothetical protein [Turicibacter sp. GALT-G1]